MIITKINYLAVVILIVVLSIIQISIFYTDSNIATLSEYAY